MELKMEALTQEEIYDWLLQQLYAGNLEELSVYKDRFRDSSKEEMDMFIKAYHEVEEGIRDMVETKLDTQFYVTRWNEIRLYQPNDASFMLTHSGETEIANKIKKDGLYTIFWGEDENKQEVCVVARITKDVEVVAVIRDED